MPAQTNIVIFRLNDKYSQAEFLHLLQERNMWAVGFGSDRVRLVTHLDFTDELLANAVEILKSLS
jgi:threonine aldolase